MATEIQSFPMRGNNVNLYHTYRVFVEINWNVKQTNVPEFISNVSV